MMMSFCKKSVHSFLGLTNPIINQPYSSSSSSPGGLGLITATGETQRTPNVLESASLKSSSSPPSSPSSSSSSSSSLAKKDPGGIRFLDEIGGGVDGLMSCTESLGFESSDEIRVDDDVMEELYSRSRSTGRLKWRKLGQRGREVKKFPPPLSSFNHNGQPSFFLRPMRKDGRLELTEVWIDRPEILRASREDGRLRLHLVKEEEDFDIDEEQEQEKEELEETKEDQEEEEEEEKGIEETKEEEERVEEWRFVGEGFRRCNELVAHHNHHHHRSNHHHNLHVWSQHCVTTR